MLLNCILRKCTEDYIFTKAQENISHFIYINDTQVLAKNEKEWEILIQTIRIFIQNLRMVFGWLVRVYGI